MEKLSAAHKAIAISRGVVSIPDPATQPSDGWVPLPSTLAHLGRLVMLGPARFRAARTAGHLRRCRMRNRHRSCADPPELDARPAAIVPASRRESGVGGRTICGSD